MRKNNCLPDKPSESAIVAHMKNSLYFADGVCSFRYKNINVKAVFSDSASPTIEDKLVKIAAKFNG